MVKSDPEPGNTAAPRTGADPRNNAREAVTGRHGHLPRASVATIDATAPPPSSIPEQLRERGRASRFTTRADCRKLFRKTKFLTSISYPSNIETESLAAILKSSRDDLRDFREHDDQGNRGGIFRPTWYPHKTSCAR